MATFETLPHFEASWRKLTREQQATFRAVVLEAFEPDLMTPDRPFQRILRVSPVASTTAVVRYISPVIVFRCAGRR